MTKEHWQQTNKDHLRTLTDSELAAADEPESMVESYDGWRNPAAFIAADTFTLFGALGDVTGRAVLDLACGPGFTSRMLAQAGASPVVGVDFSEEIIALARAQEAAQPLGIEYRVEDVAAMPVLGSFNLATVVYLFNLTPSRASLAAMFRNIHENLAGNGRLAAIVANQAPLSGTDWTEFGLRIRERAADIETTLLKVDILTEPPMPFEYYEWTREDLETAAYEGGFATVEWQPCRTPPPDEQHDEVFWRKYAEAPVSSLLTCTKLPS